MSRAHALEAAGVRVLAAVVRALPRGAALALGAALGATVGALGVRARVARENLRRAFPERTEAEREAILAAHYREIGRVAIEYPRVPELVRAAPGEVIAEVRGLEHFEAARGGGRGAIMVSGHFGIFEVLGAWMARRQPTSFVVKPLTNPRVEAWIRDLRERAGAGLVPTGGGTRGILRALHENRWVCMLADQDARRDGMFVPFFGVPTSTPRGPAAIALRTGAPIVMAFIERQADGRHVIEFHEPLPWPAPGDHDPERTLTCAHVAALEARIRRRPEQWFWLHRRWKTAPPPDVRPTDEETR